MKPSPPEDTLADDLLFDLSALSDLGKENLFIRSPGSVGVSTVPPPIRKSPTEPALPGLPWLSVAPKPPNTSETRDHSLDLTHP